MRQLLPSYVDELDHVALVSAYRYPLDRSWVRANMVSSLDGSAVKEGRSGGLGGDADEAVFGVLRGLADLVLVGAGTARAEGYRGLKAKAPYADLRAALGQRPAPVLALVSHRLDLDPESGLFTGDQRTVVVTSAASDEAGRRRLAEVADVVVAGHRAVDLSAALDQLADRGLTRVLCEGGPSLLGELVACGRLDELCLTVSPQLVGGSGPRIVAGPDVDRRFELAHLLEQDGELLSRWTAT
jgi:riboflavin biosynthesis pyrimidine reductase